MLVFSTNQAMLYIMVYQAMLGLFNQDKLLPLRYCPTQIELELVNSLADAVSLEVAEGFSNGANLGY